MRTPAPGFHKIRRMSAAGPEPEDPFGHTRMTLGEHLDELRTRLIRGCVALVIAFSVSLYYSRQLTELVRRPFLQCVERLNAHYIQEYGELVAAQPELRDKYFAPDGSFRFRIDERLSALSPTEPMWFVLKVAGYAALVFGAPFLLWQLWGFVAAGLYARERRWVRWFFPPALILFAIGTLFSYFVIVPYGMFYTMQSTPLDFVKPDIRLDFFFEFLTMLCLSMGAIFQLPMLMMFASLSGMVPPATFARMRGYFIVAAFVIAAFLTPGPDVFSQVAMATPMVVLYEIGILGGRYLTRRSGKVAEG